LGKTSDRGEECLHAVADVPRLFGFVGECTFTNDDADDENAIAEHVYDGAAEIVAVFADDPALSPLLPLLPLLLHSPLLQPLQLLTPPFAQKIEIPRQ